LENRQPNSKTCFVCGLSNPVGLGLRFYNRAPGEVSAEYVVAEQYQGYPGIVHGGIVAAMLDEGCARAFMVDNPNRFMFTARLDVRYRKNVPVGERLHLVGKAGKDKGRSATASASLYGPAGELLAEADALLIDVPKDNLPQADLEQLGWRLYD
jgi:acyl-coenzyme A thioesterase PaaI-like protein